MNNDFQMREGGEFRTISGGKRKFLYSGPVNSKGHNPEDDQWSFAPKASATTNNTPRSGLPIDLDSVWSIKNVGLAPSSKSVVSEPCSVRSEILSKNAGSAFYSRHGGMKGRVGSPNSGSGNGDTSAGGGGAKWTSSGHNFSQGSRLNNQPTAFQSPSERGFKSSRQRFQNPSPFDHDINDF